MFFKQNNCLQSELNEIIKSIKPVRQSAMDEALKYQEKLAKPPKSLGKLEEISVWLAGITGEIHNSINKKHLLVFAADNGVVDEGVSSAPQSVTLSQSVNLTRAKTGASVLAAHFGCGITVCDVGINADTNCPDILDRKIAYGTGNIAKEPAMTKEQALRAIITGAELAINADADIIGIGEMGIGNTTTASAVLSVLIDADVESVTGRGGGITDDAFRKKKEVIKNAITTNKPDKNDVIDVLSKVGGFDIAAMCGAFLGAGASGKPVVIDGFISVVAALCAARICPESANYMMASHASFEIGYSLAIKELGLSPMLNLDMRLGEGSGCPLAFQIIDAACAIINKMATFNDAGINDDYLEEIRQGDKFTPVSGKTAPKLILISGANSSGKSRFAESLVARFNGKRRYIATMIPQTEENRRKIEKHKIQRDGLGFEVEEIPYDLSEISAGSDCVVLLEDVSNLLANCIFEKGKNEDAVFEDIINLSGRCKLLIAVTISEIDPKGYDEETVGYIESINSINRKLYDKASVAISMQNGMPVYEKGTEDDIF